MSEAKITLEANFQTGEGGIGNLEEWRKHDGLLRSDILKDWLHLLMAEYEKACDDIYSEDD
jgi:hypothetical protein